MSLTFECPYCASCESTLISSFFNAVLNAKTSVYQCEQCLSLFDFPRDVKRSELQERLNDLQQDADERMVVVEAANAIGILNNQELAVTIAQIQQESLTAQLNLIRQQIATVNPANKELLDELRRQEVNTQIKLIEVQEQELQRKLSDLQEDAEERILMAAASGLSTDTGDESRKLVIVYAYDNLNNCVPVDSFWTSPSDIRSSNLEAKTLTNLDACIISGDSSVPHLLKLLFGVFQIIFGIWLLCLAFGLLIG